MSLDVTRLEKVRSRGGKLIARCPVCAREGRDRGGEHLCCWSIDGNGPFHCIFGCDTKDIFRLVGRKSTRHQTSPRRSPPATRSVVQIPRPRLPHIRQLTRQESLALARIRNWPFWAGIELMTQRGLLWQAEIWDHGQMRPSWVVADSSRLNAQARRLDGASWQSAGGSKAKSLRGSKAEFLIGAADIGNRPVVILCEGQPDYVASLGCVWFEGIDPRAVAPVCVTGTGVREFVPSILKHFEKKIVVIPVHNDPNGEGARAAEAWSRQLALVGATIRWIDFGALAALGIEMRDGRPIKDLADWNTLLGFEENRDLPLEMLSSIPEVVTAARSHVNCLKDAGALFDPFAPCVEDAKPEHVDGRDTNPIPAPDQLA